MADCTFEKHIREFETYLGANRGLSGNTLKSYRTDVLDCLTYLESQGIEALDEITIDDLRGLDGPTFPVPRAQQYGARRGRRCDASSPGATSMGIIRTNPANALKTPKIADTLPTVLSEDQAERLMDREDETAVPKSRRPESVA